MSDQISTALSAEGQARRERMHEDLLFAMQRLHRRRRVRRRAVGAAIVLLPLMVATYAWTGWPRGKTGLVPTMGERPTLTIVQMVTTDPTIIERYTSTSTPTHVTVIDDARLVSDLAAIGRPAGVIHCEGRAWLTTDVTDAGRAGDAGSSSGPSA